MSYSFTISGFSDEIDSNVVKQFEHLNKLGISYFEPRGIDGKNIADLDDGEVLALKEKWTNTALRFPLLVRPLVKFRLTTQWSPTWKNLPV